MSPNEMHPRVQKDLADVAAKTLSIIFEKSWQSSEVTGSWKKGSVTLTFKVRKDNPGNYQLVSLISVSGNTVKLTLLEYILRHMEER